MKINNIVRGLLGLILIYLIYLVIYNIKLNVQEGYRHAMIDTLTCYCMPMRYLMGYSYPPIINNYYFKEKLVMSQNEEMKLNYCERRSKSLHYDFKDKLSLIQNSSLKIFIAVMLHQNEDLFPAWFSEFQRLIQFMKPNLPFVSVLESHSRDLTPMWTLFLADYLQSNGIPHRVDVENNQQRWQPTSEILNFTDRIDYLAHLRNRVLEPLYENGEYSKLFFMNDIVFCAEDAIHLMTVEGVDAVSGLDIINVERKRYSPQFPNILATEVYDTNIVYDVWVLRDVHGVKTENDYPFFNHVKSVNYLSRGIPFQVYCTWGGMISMNAKPFYEGLRFRSGGKGNDSIKGECEASECTLICQDMWKRGYHKIVVDPLVKVYYKTKISESSFNLEKRWFLDLHPKDAHLRGKVDHIKWISEPPVSIHCCPLIQRDTKHPDYNKCKYYRIKF